MQHTGEHQKWCNLASFPRIEEPETDTVDHLGVLNKEVKVSVIDIESIGSRVKYHRLRNKISQEELAELAQVSRVHISYLERGERIPSMESFINIANALNVSADELLANNLLVTGSNMNSEEQNILFDCSVNERQMRPLLISRLGSLRRSSAEHRSALIPLGRQTR